MKPITCTRLKIASVALAVVSVGLMIASFLGPPTGVIDGSVLGGVGELFAFASLFMAWEALDRGVDAKITHGQTTLELGNDDE